MADGSLFIGLGLNNKGEAATGIKTWDDSFVVCLGVNEGEEDEVGIKLGEVTW